MATYLHGHHESVLRSHTWRTAENSAGYLIPHLTAGMSLLDIGCGPGTITRDFARVAGPTGRVHGIDRSDEVIATAQHPGDASDFPQLAFATGDVYDITAPDDTYDVVHAHQVLQHLTDPIAALTEMKRVAKPGGLVAVRDADYDAMTWFPQSDGLDDWLDLYGRLARRTGGEPNAGRHLLSWASAVDFDEVTASASVWCFATPEDREWWGGLWADRVTNSEFAVQARAHGLATKGDLAELAIAWRAWIEQDAGWFAVLNGEVLCRV